MAYQYSNAAREIASVKHLSTRLLLFTIASAVDQKTGTGFWSVDCLKHWSQLSQGAFYTAVKELEDLGLLKRERRKRGNRTNLWTLDIKKMESLRVSWASIKPNDAVPEEQEEPEKPEDISISKAFEVKDDDEPKLDDDDEKLHDLCQYLNKKYDLPMDSQKNFMPNRVITAAEKNQVSVAHFAKVMEWIMAWMYSGNLVDLVPTYPIKKGEIMPIGLNYVSANWDAIHSYYTRWEKDCAERNNQPKTESSSDSVEGV